MQDDEDGNSHEEEDEDAGDGDWLDDLIGDDSPKKSKKEAASKQQGIVLAQGSHVDLVQMDIVFRDGKYSSTRDVHAFLQVCMRMFICTGYVDGYLEFGCAVQSVQKYI